MTRSFAKPFGYLHMSKKQEQIPELESSDFNSSGSLSNEVSKRPRFFLRNKSKYSGAVSVGDMTNLTQKSKKRKSLMKRLSKRLSKRISKGTTIEVASSAREDELSLVTLEESTMDATTLTTDAKPRINKALAFVLIAYLVVAVSVLISQYIQALRPEESIEGRPTFHYVMP